MITIINTDNHKYTYRGKLIICTRNLDIKNDVHKSVSLIIY